MSPGPIREELINGHHNVRKGLYYTNAETNRRRCLRRVAHQANRLDLEPTSKRSGSQTGWYLNFGPKGSIPMAFLVQILP